MRVYISSTYQDLAEYRERIARVIRAQEQSYLAMEDYTASDDRPADKCVADVTRCDLYVLLIARRMGSGITKAEFDAAKAAKKPCLAFVLHEDATWPSKWTDTGEQAKALEAFKQEVNDYRVTQKFQASPDNLWGAFSDAFNKHLRENPPKRRFKVPTLLPYLNDRAEQTKLLKRVLVRHQQENAARPIFFVVHGYDDEEHDFLMERLAVQDLAAWLGLEKGKCQAIHQRIDWGATGKVADRVFDIGMELGEKLLNNASASLAEVASYVSGAPAPVLVHATLHEDKWDAQQPKAIAAWVKRLDEEFPDTTGRFPLLFALSVQYRRKAPSRFSLFGGTPAEKIQKALDALSLDGAKKVSAVVLPPLPSIGWSDTDDWIDGDVREFLKSQSDIDELAVWKRYEKKTKEKLFDPETTQHPMQDLAPKLHHELKGALSEEPKA